MDKGEQERSGKSGERQAWLDWLRAVSILLVLATHYQVNWRDAGMFMPVAMLAMRTGWAGVDFFFVISGFLIGNLLLGEVQRHGSLDAQRFYVRRLLKIWPLYYLTCGLYVLLSPALWRQEAMSGLELIAPALVHIQNYVDPMAMAHLWSLAVEEHFYLFLPLAILACLKLSAPDRFVRNFAILVGMLAFTAASLRVATSLFLEMDATAVRGYSHLRFDSLLCGVGLATVYRFMPRTWAAVRDRPFYLLPPAILGLLTFAFNPNRSYFVATIGYTLVALLFASCLVICSRFDRKPVPVAFARPLGLLAWIGRHSYPIYLFHPFLWQLMGDRLDYPAIVANAGFVGRSLLWVGGLLAFGGGSVAIGAFVGTFMEKPLLALRNRLMPPRSLALG